MKSRFLWLSLVSVLALVLTGCTGLFSHVSKDGGEAPRAYSPSPTGQYIVVFQGREIPPGVQAQIAAAGGEVTREFPQIGVLVAVSADPQFPSRVAAIPGVQEVGHNPVLELPDEPREPFEPIEEIPEPPAEPIRPGPGPLGKLVPLGLAEDIANNWLYVLYQWDIKRVGGKLETWQINQGAGAKVAVLDTGVDYTHPDIAPNYAYGKSYVVAHVHPVLGPMPAEDEDDYHGHGSHVASSIAAPITFGYIIGVAPQAKIYNYKVLTRHGYGYGEWIMAAIMDAADDGVHVINLSLGGSAPLVYPEVLAYYEAYARATQYAWEKGALVVAAAGNANKDLSRGPERNWPSATPAALAVSATGPDDKRAFYSNYGAFNADFAGPGGSRPAETYPNWWRDWYCLAADARNYWGYPPGTAVYWWTAGTSMAAPKVSGVAAIIYAANPGITPTGVVRILERTAEDLGKAGLDFQFGWGLVNAYRALTQ